MITFNEEKHQYTNQNNEIYTSVTTFIGKFKNKFDSEYWSLYKAIEEKSGITDKRMFNSWLKVLGFKNDKTINDLENVIVKANLNRHLLESINVRILREWKTKNLNSQEKGTALHKQKEIESYKKGVEVLGGTNIKGVVRQQYSQDIYSLEDGFYPELLLYNNYLKIAGITDKTWLTTINGIRYIDIDDYKTNGKITTNNKFQKMLSPINHLDDCNYIHYNLQVSMYAFLLEECGFKVRNLRFTHVQDNEDDIIYKVKYLRNELVQMLNFR